MVTAQTQDPHFERRWLILGVIGIAQLMVVLDATIVNIALPSAQADLGFSDANRQWIITAYALPFGSLLLLGGRISDLFGRKRAFITGLLGFAAASALGGLAQSFGVLVTARALQGAFGALLAPAALSLLAVTFTDPAERGKAFGIYGAIAGMGGAVGLLLGGVLTEVLDWRWCLFVTLVFALPAAAAGSRLLHHLPSPMRPPLDLPGTVTATTGLLALVYGFSHAESDGWTDALTLGLFVVAVVLLTVFVQLQRRAEHPLLPMRVVVDRNRGGAYFAMMSAGVGIFGVFIFLTFYLQQTLDFSPIETGVAFMPMNLSIVSTSILVNTRILARTGPRPLIPTGMGLAAVGLALLTRIEVDGGYATHVLPSLILVGIGFGLVFAPAFQGATAGVAPQDSGVASAMVNTSQQVGGAIGTALLTTLVVSATSGYVEDRVPGPAVAAEAAVHGYTVAFWVGAGIFVVGAIITRLLLRPGVLASPHAAPAAAH
ncbi:MFS transporter [Paraconexibacter algicola]|uniref:MFS transporter n=1 Tax=Paraconexibacter algicola TaxID=2133960 RepID=A0A2T4UJM6_9ACTN|nr:MFS transporter [Paraconexibacter algicola]PTL59429.1 MFS transporter [Paraconexibacter algicola]